MPDPLISCLGPRLSNNLTVSPQPRPVAQASAPLPSKAVSCATAGTGRASGISPLVFTTVGRDHQRPETAAPQTLRTTATLHSTL